MAREYTSEPETKTFYMLMSLPKTGHFEAPYNPTHRVEYIVEVDEITHSRAFGKACIKLEEQLGLEPGPHNRIRNEDYTNDPDVELGPPNSPNRNLHRYFNESY